MDQDYDETVKDTIRDMVGALGDDVEFPVMLDAITTIACNLVRQARDISPFVAECYANSLISEVSSVLKEGTCQ